MKLWRVFVTAVITRVLVVGVSAQTSLSPTLALPSDPSVNQLASAPQNPFLGSVQTEKLHPNVINLSLQDGLERGFKTNLGLFLSGTARDKSRAAHGKAISELMPHVEGSVRESAQRTNLRALGISIAALPHTVDVSNSDARIELQQSLLDLSAVFRTKAAGSAGVAASSDYKDARETVAAAVTAAYLAVLAAQSRLDFAQADFKTAQALFQLAQDRERTGLSPEVDTLRAQVEQQSREEGVIEARNVLDKQRIVLLRATGFDIHQPIHLTTVLKDESVTATGSEVALQQALLHREDYRAAQEELRSAEQARQAAEMERMPKIGAVGNYGALGTAPGNAIPTWNVAVGLRIPVFEGGRIHADVADADATLRQRQAQLEDMRTRITQEVENEILDLNAAAKQVDVAKAALGYANRALTQSRDRFSAGVTNNIEVIQAQEALANANEQWVNSVYAFNIARIALARATGTAEASARGLLAQTSQN
jgi:outer membrane protein TolC